MKIAVIHGSPSGRHSVTLHYVKWAQQRFPRHEFEIHDVGRGVKRLEKSPERLEALLTSIAEADGLLWSFPVYTFLAPANLVRFVELIHRRPEAKKAFSGKVATTLTTSEHFFDHTAHLYIEAISEDLGMAVQKGFSARMEELLAEEGRRNLEGFFSHFLSGLERGAPLEARHRPVSWEAPAYRPELPEAVSRMGKLKVALITDVGKEDENLSQMIEVFRRTCRHPVDRFHLDEIGMKGGCLGCLKCVYDGTCVYKDGFAEAFDRRIRTADILVFAGTIRHRYLSSAFKTYFDRNFRNGHRPILSGKPIGWLLSGPLRQEPNLREILEAMFEIQRSPRLGVVTDESGDEAAITERVVELARAIDRWGDGDRWIRPPTFLAVGGQKVFRDLMYSVRGLVRADHAYYRREGLYDFPQRDLRRTLFNWGLAALMEHPRTRGWTLRKVGDLKVLPFRKLVGE